MVQTVDAIDTHFGVPERDHALNGHTAIVKAPIRFVGFRKQVNVMPTLGQRRCHPTQVIRQATAVGVFGGKLHFRRS